MASEIIFIPHGGGPLPLLNDMSHQALIACLSSLSETIKKPKAIVMVSAHWEEKLATLSSSANPPMIYDYSGFPEESYSIQYPALGDTQLATKIKNLLQANNIPAELNNQRGFDHGTFVPLKLIYPNADIPVVQLSLINHLNGQAHINLGKALAALSEENILIIGSGSSFHNLSLMRHSHPETNQRAQAFDDWLNEKLLDNNSSQLDKEHALANWQAAPYARFCHPREEHFLPLFVCLGAALVNNFKARSIFKEEIMGIPMSGFLWKA